RFVEMEYAVAREALPDTLRELKAMVDRSPLRVSFPVEVRTAPADDITLSTASGRDSAYIAVHMFRGTPHQAYFTAAERIFTAHEGRPHWGKIHTRDASHLSGVYPRFGEVTALRDRLDPDRGFRNDYLRRVLRASGPPRVPLPVIPWRSPRPTSRQSGRGGQVPSLARSWAARPSAHVARMEYCGEPWVRSPVRVLGTVADRREGASCTG